MSVRVWLMQLSLLSKVERYQMTEIHVKLIDQSRWYLAISLQNRIATKSFILRVHYLSTKKRMICVHCPWLKYAVLTTTLSGLFPLLDMYAVIQIASEPNLLECSHFHTYSYVYEYPLVVIRSSVNIRHQRTNNGTITEWYSCICSYFNVLVV